MAKMHPPLSFVVLAVLLAACGSNTPQPGPVDSGSPPSDGAADTSIDPNRDAESDDGAMADATPDADARLDIARDPDAAETPPVAPDVDAANDVADSSDTPNDQVGEPNIDVVQPDREAGGTVCNGVTREPASHRPQPVTCAMDGGKPDGAPSYVCASDTDCAGNTACACNTGYGGLCLSNGNCRTDADCGPGGYCSLSLIPGGLAPDGTTPYSTPLMNGYFCHTSHDCCLDTSECAPNGWPADTCLYNRVFGNWVCAGGP